VSEIERYLDELFDRLAGHGAAGRRVLTEAEDHLRAAAADAVARGLTTDEAEHDAVTRFGSPVMVARKMRSAHGAGRLNQALSAGWLLAGMAAAGLGVAYLVAAGRLGWRSPACSAILSPSCAAIAGPMAHLVPSAAIAAAAGAALLLGRSLAVRFAGLAPVHRGFALAVGLVLVLAAAGFGMVGQTPVLPAGLRRLVFALPFWLWGWSRLVAATALIECLAAAVTLADSRPRRYIEKPRAGVA
jgi:hypothetical protein